MKSLTIRAIGSSAGVVLPKEILTKLRAEKGDELYVVETPNGIELTLYDPDFAKDMDVAKNIISKNRNLLKKLAE